MEFYELIHQASHFILARPACHIFDGSQFNGKTIIKCIHEDSMQ